MPRLKDSVRDRQFQHSPTSALLPPELQFDKREAQPGFSDTPNNGAKKKSTKKSFWYNIRRLAAQITLAPVQESHQKRFFSAFCV
ncbi:MULTISPECIES: hypothetical protein [Silvimonas]|uniref:hypothetical protein n=1 Tax=Silvimonas TaxID=300264 RepID=UPI0024B359DB|nr:MULTISPECIES: hypothetical protein [Silvimonas]MDR3428528.1 hypothetical protein [Silvimonas sp.]